MKRLLPLLFVLPLLATVIALTPQPAAAVGGLNLAWGECGGAGTADKVSACTSNTGANVIYGSFAAPMDMAQFNGILAVLDVTTDTDPMVAWWSMQPGGCRAGALSGSFDFTSGPFTCTDIWAGAGSGGTDYANPLSSGSVATASATNHSRIRLVCAVATAAPIVADGTEYYGFKVTLTNTKTTGTGSCAGCSNKACIVFNSLLMTQPAGVGDAFVTNAIGSTQVTWQGGGADCSSVPVHSKTWGQVKSLYR
jgi:hypothetical protein